MVWFRVDDVITFHPRVLEAGNAAMGLWLRAGAWSMAQLSDGHIPTAIARQLGTTTEIRRLVTSGLWETADGGYQFHAWAEAGDGTARQPTREQVHAKRASERDRKRKAGQKGADTRWNPDGSGAPSARKPPGSATESGPPASGSGAPSDGSRPVPSRPMDSHLDEVSPVPERARATTDDDESNQARREAYWRGWGIANPLRVVAALHEAVERPITEDQAISIIAGILAKAKKRPDSNERYVLASIRQSWAEIQQELDEAAVAA